jgi:glutamyl-tRNA reductase
VIGAGKMGRTAAKRLKLEGAHEFVVVNRNYERAEELVSSLGIGTAAGLDGMAAALRGADIVISSTGALNFVLKPDMIAAAMAQRPNRPLFLIDIAVPRDVDPAVAHIPGVYLTDIDQLGETIDITLEHRQAAVPLVEQIIDAHVMQFERWYRSHATIPVVASLARKAEALREAEIERLFARCPDLDKRQRTLVTGLSLRLMSKLLHPAIASLRDAGSPDELADSVARAELIREIFALSERQTLPAD